MTMACDQARGVLHGIACLSKGVQDLRGKPVAIDEARGPMHGHGHFPVPVMTVARSQPILSH